MNTRKLVIGALAAAVLVMGSPVADARSGNGVSSGDATWYVYDNHDNTFTVTKMLPTDPKAAKKDNVQGDCSKPDPDHCSGSAGAYMRADKYSPWVADNR